MSQDLRTRGDQVVPERFKLAQAKKHRLVTVDVNCLVSMEGDFESLSDAYQCGEEIVKNAPLVEFFIYDDKGNLVSERSEP